MMDPATCDVSVVLPCLNEEQTLPDCIAAGLRVLEQAGLSGEIIVADNGSTDNSRAIAADLGARLVEVETRGYGSALRAGLANARARFMVFLDADMSYDFEDIPRFVEELEKGADVVIGSRLKGVIDPGAMPLSHRILGTPALTLFANTIFRCGISDINCGMRGLTREAFDKLDLHSEGMEFASEMMVKAALVGLERVEIPISFHADQRDREPHLRSFRDGWRHLQLMLHFCPLWLFLLPGLVLTLGGLAALIPGWDTQWASVIYLAAPIAASFGVMTLLLGLIAQGRINASKYAWKDNPPIPRSMSNWVRIEKGVVLGLAAVFIGALLFLWAIPQTWPAAGGQAPSPQHLRWALLGATILIAGFQVFFVSLFMGLFGIRVADDQLGRPREVAEREGTTP